MAKTLPDSLKRTAITRLANLDFELAPPAPLPDAVIARFPELRRWHESELERHRNNDRLIREAITALREHREDVPASTTTTIIQQAPVSSDDDDTPATPSTPSSVAWDDITGKPECFTPCEDELPTTYYQLVEDEGVPLTQRNALNFVGDGVTVTDAGGKTVVTIPGSGAITTIYTGDGALAGNRTVDCDGKTITFHDFTSFIRLTDSTLLLGSRYFEEVESDGTTSDARFECRDVTGVETSFLTLHQESGYTEAILGAESDGINSASVVVDAFTGGSDVVISATDNLIQLFGDSRLLIRANNEFQLRTPGVVALTTVAGQFLKLVNATTGQAEFDYVALVNGA